MNHQTAIGARMTRRWPLLATLIAFAAMLFVVPTAQADHNRNRTIWYGGGSRNNAVYQSCARPSWEEIEFDRGYQTGLRDGRRRGYADGRNWRPKRPYPKCDHRGYSQFWDKGYHQAYTRAYLNSFQNSRQHRPQYRTRGRYSCR